MNKFFYIILLVFLFYLSGGCSDEITNPSKKQFSTTLSGKVILQNQTEHSNALIYIDSLNRGVSSDSNGSYTLFFDEEDSVYNGVFKLIYFLSEYEMDSAKIFLFSGKVKLDTLDVDAEGKIKTKTLMQLVSIEGWTDKTKYRIGDKVTFTARVTNTSEGEVHVSIYSCSIPLSNFIFLYNDKYPPFTLGGRQDVLTADCDIYLAPNEYYEGIVSNDVIEYRPLIPDNYIVMTGFIIEERTLNHLESKFYKYIVEEWYKIHRGSSPKFDSVPNKFNFPYVIIIN